MIKRNITPNDFTRIAHSYKLSVVKLVEEITPQLNELYDILKKKKSIYNPDLDKMANLHKLEYCGDADYYAGIVDPKFFTHNKRAIYFHMEQMQIILQFVDEKYVDSFHRTFHKGIQIFRIYEPLDVDCIEKSWGIKTTEQWATKLSLTADTFSDETKHSQKVGDGRIAVHRPTIKRYLEIHNAKLNPCYYGPIITTSDYIEGNYQVGEIQGCIYAISAMSAKFKIKGISI